MNNYKQKTSHKGTVWNKLYTNIFDWYAQSTALDIINNIWRLLAKHIYKDYKQCFSVY